MNCNVVIIGDLLELLELLILRMKSFFAKASMIQSNPTFIGSMYENKQINQIIFLFFQTHYAFIM